MKAFALALLAASLAPTTALGEEAKEPPLLLPDRNIPADAEQAPGDDPPHSSTNHSPSSYVSALIGPMFSVTGKKDRVITFGGRIGTAVWRNEVSAFSLGIAIETLTRDEVISGSTVKTRVNLVALEAIARRLWGSGLYCGGRIGTAIVSLRLPGTNSFEGSSPVLALGPAAGYEFSVSRSLSLIVDASFISHQGGVAYINDIAVPFSSMATFVLQGGLQAHF